MGIIAFKNLSTITSNASHPLDLGKSCYHVHRDVGPWSIRYYVWVERRCLQLRARLGSLTGFAAFYVGVHRFLHLGPPIVSEDQFHCFRNAWVSREVVVVALGG